MDATIVASIIQSAATLGGALISKWRGEPETDNTQVKIREVIKPNYDYFRITLTETLVAILHALEVSNYDMPVSHLRQRVYPDLRLDRDVQDRFDNEFKYRVEFLRMLGLLQLIGTSEYTISHLGIAFLREARARGDHQRVL